MKLKQRGFTLIELLVVIAIIALLASIILASLNSAREKGRDAARVSDIKEVQLALELYYDANNGYPADAGSSPYAIPSALQSQGDISATPVDPTNSGSYKYAYYASNASKAACSGSDTGCASYLLVASLESGAQTGGYSGNGTAVTAAWPDASGVNCAATSSAPYTYCVTN